MAEHSAVAHPFRSPSASAAVLERCRSSPLVCATVAAGTRFGPGARWGPTVCVEKLTVKSPRADNTISKTPLPAK